MNVANTRIVGEVAEVFLLVKEHFRVVQSDAGPRHAVKLADGSEAYVESRSGKHCQYFLSCRIESTHWSRQNVNLSASDETSVWRHPDRLVERPIPL